MMELSRVGTLKCWRAKIKLKVKHKWQRFRSCAMGKNPLEDCVFNRMTIFRSLCSNQIGEVGNFYLSCRVFEVNCEDTLI